MSSSKPKVSLPVVAAEDYRHAVAGEPWELCPVAITGPIEYRSLPRDGSIEATRRLAEISLRTPLDFPAITDAILDGDHVALAVDPNVPRVAEIIEGVLTVLRQCQAGRVSIVLWSEASDPCLHFLTQKFQTISPDVSDGNDASDVDQYVTVTRHNPRDRRELRYVAADADAEAIYLARDLVDADFTLPIIAARASDAAERFDKAAIFPLFADSSTMRRYQTTVPLDESAKMALEIGWLLGVQLQMMVSSDAAGSVARILTGTPEAIRSELDTLHAEEHDESGEHETRPHAELVVAALDGDANVQTWSNVARAAVAASQYTEGDAAIVIWSQLHERPSPLWQQELANRRERSTSDEYEYETDDQGEDSLEESGSAIAERNSPAASDFANWHTDRAWARKLAELMQSQRLFLHSQLSDTDVESLGIGIISSVEELHRLGQTCQAAGMLRAAQFQAASVARFDVSAGES